MALSIAVCGAAGGGIGRAMRDAFVAALLAAAERDSRVWLLTGDLGYGVLEPFAKRFPDRFLNVGIAEQNMAGVAAGLAMAGKMPFIYSIANFPTLRCLEQIRNDIVYHQLPVRVVAVGGGLAYGSLGYSHHAVEDLAILRALPGMVVTAPGDPLECEALVEALCADARPAYLRLGKANETTVHVRRPQVELGRAIWLREGSHVALASTGGTLPLAVRAADQLALGGVDASVISFPTVSPLEGEAVTAALQHTGGLVVIEEHGPGGLHGAISELVTDAGLPNRVRSVRLQTGLPSVAGSQAYLRAQGGVTVEQIVASAREFLPRFAVAA